jgi:hypothetical protein
VEGVGFLTPEFPSGSAYDLDSSQEKGGMSMDEVVYFDEMAQKSLPEWLKTALTVLVPLLVAEWLVLNVYLPDKITSQTSGISGDVSSLKTDMGNARSDIQRIDANVNGMLKDLVNGILETLKGLRAQKASVSRQTLILAANVARDAKRGKVLTDPAAVAEAAQDVLQIAAGGSELKDVAWTTATELANYRSFLNASLVPNPQPRERQSGATEMEFFFTREQVDSHQFSTGREA